MNPPAPSRPPLPRWTVPVVAAVVLVASGVVLWALWRWIDGLALADAGRRATAQLDAVRAASGIAIGGGLFALYLSARRQRTQELELAQRERAQAHTEQVAETNRLHAERVAAAAEDDAAARRVTELHTKAGEQLGSDKAPVRPAGLYALERLAQENPDQRQTVVNLLCAYLRMPYTLPGDEEDQALRDARRQEREVRLTAQRVLATRLRDAGDADFSRASFTDGGWFIEASFDGNADFSPASFAARASFRGTSIAGDALFDAVSFDGSADFEAAELTGVSSFVGATLPEHALEVLWASADARSFRDRGVRGRLPATRALPPATGRTRSGGGRRRGPGAGRGRTAGRRPG